MTTDATLNISNMEGLSDKASLGPFLRKHEQGTSSSSPSRRFHRRSNSSPTVVTASSSLSADTESDKQTSSYGDKSSTTNLSDSIEEESDFRQGENTHYATAAAAIDPEQPDSDGDEGIEVAADTEEGGTWMEEGGTAWQNIFSGMSSLIAGVGGPSLAASYRSQPQVPEGEGRKLHEEEKKEEHDTEAVAPAPVEKKLMEISAPQEEEAMLRFDLLKDLVMMGEAEMYDDISPPNPQPVEDESNDRKGYFVQENLSSGCGGRGVKRMLVCGVVALFLLSALIIPLYMSNDANRKAAAALAAVETPIPTANPTTPSPTATISPSQSPSASHMPSNLPTHAPSSNPTMSNMPTGTPSLRPTASNVPSQIPSISQIPSWVPSNPPSTSMEPSNNPSQLPSYEPSASMMPSYSTISPDYAFKVRLQWQRSYFWQEEKVERFWCLECVRCTSYGGGDGNEHGCRSYSTGDEGVCQRGDSIWIRDCRSRGNRFNVLENRDSGFMLRVATTDLCVTRERRRWLKVDYCDRSDTNQQFVPWDNYDKFELRPLAYKDWGEREADCISQLHHPKQDELVSLHNCRLCRIYETRYWQVYMG